MIVTACIYRLDQTLFAAYYRTGSDRGCHSRQADMVQSDPTGNAVSFVLPIVEEGEEMWVRGLLIATTVLLVLIMPLCIAVSTGEMTDFARSVAGIFSELPN